MGSVVLRSKILTLGAKFSGILQGLAKSADIAIMQRRRTNHFFGGVNMKDLNHKDRNH